MKTLVSCAGKLLPLLLLAGALVTSGCAQDATALAEAPAEEPTAPKLAAAEVPPSDLPAESTGPFSAPQPPPGDLELVPVKAAEVPAFKTSLGVADIIKLVESGADESVILTFVDNSHIAYDLSADEIVYLKDNGISEAIINAMMKRGAALPEKAGATPAEPKPAAESSGKDPANTLATLEAQKQAQGQTGALPETPPQPAETTADPPPPTYVDNAQQPVYVEQPVQTQPVTVNYFYSSLSPYGYWYDLPGYGWCWQPRVVVTTPTWSPYCQGGRWTYSNFGWYWASDYSWGWAPFHYGRWWSHPSRGWVWFPGSVWSPAWVTWRTGGSYCGWAPVPPARFCGSTGVGVSVGFSFGLGASHYTFVSYKDFCNRNLYQNRLPYGQSFPNTTVVNNTFVGPNNTVINRGVGLEPIASASRAAVPRVEIKDLPVNRPGVIKVDRMERRGNALVVNREPLQLKPTQAPALSASLSPRDLRQAITPVNAASRSDLSPAVESRSAVPRGTPIASLPGVEVPHMTQPRSTNPRGTPVQTDPTPAVKPSSPPVLSGRSAPTPGRYQPPTPVQAAPVANQPARPTIISRSVVNSGIQPSGNRPVIVGSQPPTTRPPGFSVPQSSATPTVSVPRSQPVIIGQQPSRPQAQPRGYNNYQAPAPQIRGAPAPQYHSQPAVTPTVRPQISPPVQMQRSAPVASAPSRGVASSPQAAPQSRPSAPSAPLRR